MLCKPRNKQASAAPDEIEKGVRRDPREFHNWAGRGAAKIILPKASFSEVRILICTFTLSSSGDKNGSNFWKHVRLKAGMIDSLIGNRNFQLG